MAIIKCPECGHQISDKAPTCPHCGVEIAGKITKCPNCGQTYFNEETTCPFCHATDKVSNSDGKIRQIASDNSEIGLQNDTKTDSALSSQKQTSLPQKTDKVNKQGSDDKKCNKSSKTILIVSLIIAVVIVIVFMVVYQNAKSKEEQEKYDFALNSNEIEVAKEYLYNFKDAPQEHIDSITAHLQLLLKQNQNWTDAVVSGSRTALVEFLKAYPNSIHAKEAADKIDSIDWEQCLKLNTPEAYQTYIDTHSDGLHYGEALTFLNKLKASEVTLEERLTISGIFHDFFISINTRNENTLTTHFGESINFLGKQDATRNDVVSFMDKLYKDNVESMVWSIPGSYEIRKKETGDGLYEYDTTFMAEQKVNNVDGTEMTNTFHITAVVNPDGKITEMSMSRIVE